MKNKIKNITYITIILTILVVISLIVGMIININRMYSEYKEQAISLKSNISDQDDYNELVDNYEEASSAIGKTVEDVKNEENLGANTNENTIQSESNTKTETKVEEKKEVEPIIEIPDPTFIKPIEGDIIKEYSKENLVYSETLKEWTTHTGIDIEADLTTVVKAASDGTVKSIKNDPRYGITVIIEHSNGYETRYSNLLTAEFVTIGENVTAEQTIGTVGSTASFEILDKPHLHFEILKDNEYLDPTTYIKE